LLGTFFFSSLEGNGSFLSIKDAVTCLQRHVGYNLVRTRNFCQLIFSCPSGCLEHRTGSTQLSRVLGAGSGALGLAGVTGTCPHIALSRCCLFAHVEGSLGGSCVALCLQPPLLQEPSALGNRSVPRVFR